MSEDWNSECGPIKIKTAKNGQGLDRTLAAAPAAKKSRTVVPSLSIPTNVSAASTALVEYVDSINPKLDQRVKTVLQMKITSAKEPSKSDMVVLSGATFLKKLNQLCAFITGHQPNYEYHSQRGTTLKGSGLELSFNDGVVWIADKASKKKADEAGVAHVVDASLKVVHLFQGLTVRHDSGIVFDSEMAQSIANTPRSVTWVSPDGQRYDISVVTIVAAKSLLSNQGPLPRLVKHSEILGPSGS